MVIECILIGLRLRRAYAMGAAWLGHKMRTSHVGIVRKLWWLPQTYSIEQNVWGYAYTRAHYRR
jgi:hypothetical protein